MTIKVFTRVMLPTPELQREWLAYVRTFHRDHPECNIQVRVTMDRSAESVIAGGLGLLTLYDDE